MMGYEIEFEDAWRRKVDNHKHNNENMEMKYIERKIFIFRKTFASIKMKIEIYDYSEKWNYLKSPKANVHITDNDFSN